MARLEDALRAAIEEGLAGARDSIIRVDVPKDWPLPAALSTVTTGLRGKRLRVGILRPFKLQPFKDLRADLSGDGEKITRWRNETSRTAPVVVCGRAEGENTAGLRDFKVVLRRREVLDGWRRLEGSGISGTVGKPEVDRLVDALFDACVRGAIEAKALDMYLEGARAATPQDLSPLFREMWKARLLPDDQALDRGAARRRLEANLAVVTQLETTDERGVVRKLREASKGNDRKAASARAALAFMKSLESKDLEGARLEDISAILGATSGTEPKRRSSDFEDLLDLHKVDSVAVREALQQLSAKWDLEDADEKTLEVEATVNGAKQRFELALQPRSQKRKRASGEERDRELMFPWTGVIDGAPPLLAVSESLTAIEFSTDGAWKTRTTAEVLQSLGSLTDPAAPALVAAFEKYVTARLALRLFEPWLYENALELFVLRPDAVAAATEFVSAWQAVVEASLSLHEAGQTLKLLQMLEAAWGPSLAQPQWAFLGPLHPYLLDPLLRVASHVLKAIELDSAPSNLGEAMRWLVERCVPAYPALYHGDRTLHFARLDSGFAYSETPCEQLPPADEGHGLSQIIQSIAGFAPHLRQGLVLTLVDPPRGRALAGELARVQQELSGGLTVHVVTTRPDANTLDEVDGDVRYVGRFASLNRFVNENEAGAHVVVRFSPQPAGAVAARQGWKATAGSFLAPHLDVSLDPLGETPNTPVASVKIEPRESNAVVCCTQDLYRKQTGNVPKHFEFHPMLPLADDQALRKLARRADWLVVGSSGPMGLANPSRINNELNFVGRDDLGPYGLYVYASDSLFTVRRFIEQALRNEPVTVPEATLVERITELAKRSGAAILKMGKRGLAAGVAEHQAALVALNVAREGVGELAGEDVVLRVDDLGWTRIWLGEGQRCDYLLIRINTLTDGPRITVRAVESKSFASTDPVEPGADTEPFKKALSQVDATLGALQRVVFPSAEPTLDEDVRFATLVEHVMAAALAADPDFKDLARVQRVVGVLNEFSARRLTKDEVRFDGAVVVTQVGTNADRAERRVVSEGRYPVRLVRATAQDVSALFGAVVSAAIAGGATGGGQPNSGSEGGYSPPLDEMLLAAEQTPAAAAPNRGAGSGSESGSESESPGASVVIGDGALPPPDADSKWANDIARELILVCQRHEIPVACAEPVRVTLGPSLVGVSVRLKVGAQLGTIDRRLEDIMRDLGMGDRSREVSVGNDAEPSTVRFLLPRPHRAIPPLPLRGARAVGPTGYLPLLLGRTLEGEDFESCVQGWPHLLVAGTTGSGKTTFLRSLLLQLGRFGRGFVELIIVDGKGETDYVGVVPDEMFHTAFPRLLLGHEPAKTVLEWALEEMERRKTLLHELVRKTSAREALKWPDVYRDEASRGQHPSLSPVVIVIDEFADIMLAGKKSGDDFLDAIQRVAQMGRSRMVHLVLATQRPDKETIRGAIKSNLDARVVLRLPTSADSMTVLGTGGAERLLKQGDLLFQTGGTIVRLQGYSC